MNKEERMIEQQQIMERINSSTTKQKRIYNLNQSIDKVFEYISNISKVPFTVEIDGKTKEYFPPKRVVVSNSLYKGYSCLDYGCSKCCWYCGFHNILTDNQYTRLQEEVLDMNLPYSPKGIQINGAIKRIWTHDHTTKICYHLSWQTNSCRIHRFGPLHCVMPLTKVERRNGVTYIMRIPFGRNIRYMQCPVVFREIRVEDFDHILFQLSKLKETADEFEIPTYIDNIISQVEEKKKQFLQKQNKLEV